MTEEDKAAVRALAARRDPRLPRSRLSRTRTGLARAAARDDGVARVRGRARRVRADAPRGDGARRARLAAGRRARRRRGAVRVPGRRDRVRRVRAARRHPAEGSRHPVHDRREERGRRRHVVGEHLPGRARRRRQPLLLLQLRAQRPLDRVLRAATRAAGVLRGRDGEARHRAARPVRARGARRDVGRRARRLVGTGPRQGRHRGHARRARRDLGGRSAQPAARSRHPRAGRLRRSGVPLRALGPRGRPHRQARRDDRRRRERLPDRPDDRARRRAPHGVPAHRAVDVPEPELPRAGRSGRAVGAAAPAVLRALVPVPDLLARVRQGPRGRARRPRLPRPAASRSAR